MRAQRRSLRAPSRAGQVCTTLSSQSKRRRRHRCHLSTAAWSFHDGVSTASARSRPTLPSQRMEHPSQSEAQDVLMIAHTLEIAQLLHPLKRSLLSLHSCRILLLQQVRATVVLPLGIADGGGRRVQESSWSGGRGVLTEGAEGRSAVMGVHRKRDHQLRCVLTDLCEWIDAWLLFFLPFFACSDTSWRHGCARFSAAAHPAACSSGEGFIWLGQPAAAQPPRRPTRWSRAPHCCCPLGHRQQSHGRRWATRADTDGRDDATAHSGHGQHKLPCASSPRPGLPSHLSRSHARPDG